MVKTHALFCSMLLIVQVRQTHFENIVAGIAGRRSRGSARAVLCHVSAVVACLAVPPCMYLFGSEMSFVSLTFVVYPCMFNVALLVNTDAVCFGGIDQVQPLVGRLGRQ